MKKILYAFLTVLFMLPLLQTEVSVAVPEKLVIASEKAVILFMEGDVKIKTMGDTSWKIADVGMTLYKGDSLRTGRDSWAEIGIGKNFMNVVRVKEETQIELTELGPITLGLLKGEIRSLVEKLGKETTFEIKTPTAVCGARGTGWDTNTDGRRVIVDAYEDEVYFYAIDRNGEPIMDDPIIEAGNRGVLTDPLQPITIQDIPPDRIKDWNDWKEDYRDRRGIDEGADIRTKTEQMESAQDTSDTFTKGKEGILEKGDQSEIDRRTETKSTESSSN